MSGATGQVISHDDFDAIRNKVIAVLGSGAGSTGYGQTVLSTYANTSDIIYKSSYDALRYDLINIGLHQTGVVPIVTQISTTDPVRYGPGNPNTDYNSLIDSYTASKFATGIGQNILTLKQTQSSTATWYTTATAQATVSFSTADQARYFFNSGGQILFNVQRIGGSSTPRNGAWTNILNTAGLQGLGGANGVYTLTNTDQRFYTINSSTPYSNNHLDLNARCNVANNSSGTATVFTVTAVLTDYITGAEAAVGDYVDGTLSFSLYEQKASGAMQPSGTFTIASPTYSLSITSIS